MDELSIDAYNSTDMIFIGTISLNFQVWGFDTALF